MSPAVEDWRTAQTVQITTSVIPQHTSVNSRSATIIHSVPAGTKSAMRTTTTASSVAETAAPMTVVARDVTTVISTVPIPLPSVTEPLTSVAAGTTMTAMSEISVTQTPMFVSLSVWRTRSVWVSTRFAMSSTTTASTVALETAKHLSVAVQV